MVVDPEDPEIVFTTNAQDGDYRLVELALFGVPGALLTVWFMRRLPWPRRRQV